MEVWRKPKGALLPDGVRPFKMRGVVRGVAPELLLADHLSLDFKKTMPSTNKKAEVKMIEDVDWQSWVWLEEQVRFDSVNCLPPVELSTLNAVNCLPSVELTPGYL